MWRQTMAMFVDGYRELNSKRMFWIAMAVSAVVIGLFAGIRVSENEISVFGLSPDVLGINMDFSIFRPMVIYKFLFAYLIVGFWLTFGATSLGMFSVASIFPDFMTGGAIDLYLSRPISRLRLFVTKYLSGLVFVVLQMIVFGVLSYFILGFRAGLWDKSVFLAIPIVTCYFSYLYSVNIFFGVFTRSTLVSVILTFIVWVTITAVQASEQGVYLVKRVCEQNVEHYSKLVELNQRDLEKYKVPVADGEFPVTEGMIRKTEQALEENRLQKTLAEERLGPMATAHKYIKIAALILPKTGETSNLLSTKLLADEEARVMINPGEDEHRQRRAAMNPDPQRVERMNREAGFRKDAQLEIRDRSVWWIVGTSLGFEAVLIGLAAWRFCKREY